MVHADQQTVLLLGQLQQAATDQWTTAQIEGRVGFLFGVMLRGNLGIWRMTQIDAGQREADIRRSNHLDSAIIAGDEAGAQYLVAGDDTIQCLLECGQIQHPVQVHAAIKGVSLCGTAVELRQEP